MHTYNFKTIEGEEIKVIEGDLRAIEYNTNEHHQEVVTIHLHTTGKEYNIDASNKIMLQNIRNLVTQQQK